MPIKIIGGTSMNWRRLIYSIVIPSISSFIFVVVISIGTINNTSIFFFFFVMMIAAALSSTGKGKNGDALSTIVMGLVVTAAMYLFFMAIGDLGHEFSWSFVLETAGFMATTALSIYFARSIMENNPNN